MKPGDFTTLADAYAKNRPGYSRDVLTALRAFVPTGAVIADVGAGTGIWTRMLAELEPRTLYAIEPNDAMRAKGAEAGGAIWRQGEALRTGLDPASVDLLTMASSFHWAKPAEAALAEFKRVLKPGGVFVALWNPRLTERSAIETAIDEALRDRFGLGPRISSGRGGITLRLPDLLREHFARFLYVEAEDEVSVPRQRYIGAWESVNDVRTQLGEAKFREFMSFVADVTAKVDAVPVTYLTRAWIART